MPSAHSYTAVTLPDPPEVAAPAIPRALPRVESGLFTRGPDSVFPNPIPPAERHSRRISSYSDVTGGVVVQDYVTTGTFNGDATDSRFNSLVRVDTLSFDGDLVDYVIHRGPDDFIEELHRRYAAHVFRVSDGKWAVSDQISSFHTAKYWLHVLPDEALEALKQEHRSILLPVLKTILGEPTRLVDSGYGVQPHYWLSESQGSTWDPKDPRHVREVAAALIARVNSELGFSALDPNAKDLGTRVLRDVGTYNLKGSEPRPVRLLFQSDRTLDLDEIALTKPRVPAVTRSSSQGYFYDDLVVTVPRKRWTGPVSEWLEDGPKEKDGDWLKSRTICPFSNSDSDSAWISHLEESPYTCMLHCKEQHHNHPHGHDEWKLVVFDRVDDVALAVALHRELGAAAYNGEAVYKLDSKRNVWELVPDEDLARRIHRFAGMPYWKADGRVGHVRISNARVQGTLAVLRAQVDGAVQLRSLRDGMAFSNGFLRADGQLVAQTAEQGVRAQDVVDYPFEHAECPLWEQYLQDVFEGDEDEFEKVQCLAEIVGAALLGISCRYQRHAILFGPLAANGKSVCTTVVSRLFPRSMVASSSPSAWEKNKFGLTTLENARLNVITEMPTMGILGTAIVKAVFAGEPVQFERKYKDPRSFTPNCAHLFAANTLPFTRDRTEGFFRRHILITFNNRFVPDPGPKEKRADPDIVAKLLTERPGIAMWAVRGARRLQKQGHYTVPPSHERAVLQWKLKVDSVRHFASEHLVADASGRLPAKQLYGAIQAWLVEQSLKKLSYAQIQEELLRLGFVKNQRSSAGQTWQVRLIDIKPNQSKPRSRRP